ncbi:MAG: hypothetical protein QW303_00285 [Nitrososphaerota archaeon]
MTDYYTSEYSSRRLTDPTIDQAVGADVSRQVHPTVHPSVHPPMPVHPQSPLSPRQYTYSQDIFHVDWRNFVRQAIKYLVEGLAVAFVAYYFVGKGRLDIKDIVLLGITAAFVFAILDTFSPTIALGTRFGAGFGIGQGLFGVGPSLIAGPVRPMV